MADRLIKERRLENDAWKVVPLNAGDDPAAVRLPVGPLLVPVAVWQARKACLIACPGGDFCSLANAKSLPIAAAIQERFADLDYLHDIGELELNISGCMNSCGHHHLGGIGILGVDKNGEEWYQIALGGAQGNNASIGQVIGRSFAAADVADVVEKLIETYLARRHADETFNDTVRRIGLEPFRASVYANVTRERKIANG